MPTVFVRFVTILKCVGEHQVPILHPFVPHLFGSKAARPVPQWCDELPE